MRLGKRRASPNRVPVEGLIVVTLSAAMGLPGVGGILRSDQNDKSRKAGRSDNQKALSPHVSNLDKKAVKLDYRERTQMSERFLQEAVMTTLVLGGTGFIGRRAVRRLAERGERVAVMDINPNAVSFDEFGDLVSVMRGDITEFEDVVKAVLACKPDRIMNLAYLLGSGDDTPHFTMKLNVLGMDNSFEAARVCGVDRVVYASSVAVSGQQSAFGDRLVNEDDPMHGTSQYAMHKRFNEFQAEQFNSVYGMNITGIRPANVTGPDKVRGSTDHVRCVVLPASGEPVSFPKSGFMRLPVHVEDVAEAFVRVTLADNPHHTVYNTGGIAISMGDLADIVRGFLPDADISFDSDGGKEESGNYLVDNGRLLGEFELEYPPLETLGAQTSSTMSAATTGNRRSS